MMQPNAQRGRPDVRRGTKRVGAALAMGFVGAIVLGSPSLLIAVIGFWSYPSGLGGMLTGFTVGAVYGWRIPFRDAVAIFMTAYGILLGAIVQGGYAGHDWYWTLFVALALSPGPAVLMTIALPTLVPPRWRYRLATGLSILFGLGLFSTALWISLFRSVS